jgi:hypothetical protein
VRANKAIGVERFFLTDDNLARNRNWEACFDRLIELKKKEGLTVRLQVQVDTLCHKIPGFIEKGVKAGIDQVFIGMENINPDNLAAVKKKQNKITDYREMLLAWKKHSVVITAGYIIGFPNDTRESILHDVDVIKRELPLDLIYFTNLTPLPGSEDHQRMTRNGEWMDPDLNKYDLNHRVTHHARMSDAEWDKVYAEVWHRFYSMEHMETILKRMAALGSNKKLTTLYRLLWYRDFYRLYKCHPLEGGFGRIKVRTDRRYGMKRENPVAFYARFAGTETRNVGSMLWTYTRLRGRLRRSGPIRPRRSTATSPSRRQRPTNSASASIQRRAARRQRWPRTSTRRRSSAWRGPRSRPKRRPSWTRRSRVRAAGPTASRSLSSGEQSSTRGPKAAKRARASRGPSGLSPRVTTVGVA